MKNLKFERVNMKLVVIIAAIIIVLLTAAFIIFRTNLIIDHKDKNEKDPVVENPGGTTNPENPEKPDDPSNPGGTTDPSNPGGTTNPSNPGGNTNPDDPSIYDDPDENTISDSAKNRTKKAEKLTVAEKEYIIKENIEKEILKDKDMQADCGGKYFCVFEADEYLKYSNDKDIGKKIEGCKGKVITTYDSEDKKVEFDLTELECE